MGIYKLMQSIFAKELISDNKSLTETIIEDKVKIEQLASALNKAEKEKSVWQDKATSHIKFSEQQEFWNNKWKKNKIVYKARGKYEMDVRNLVLNKSNVLEKVIKNYSKLSDDDKVFAILRYVIGRLTYVSDDIKMKQTEHWQHPEITYQERTGDCEDGALLIASLIRIAGIPSYRIKVCAGWVANPMKPTELIGHAYAIYLADDNKWYTLDWCYWPENSKTNFKKIQHNNELRYRQIWWTFNDEFSWAQKSLKI